MALRLALHDLLKFGRGSAKSSDRLTMLSQHEGHCEWEHSRHRVKSPSFPKNHLFCEYCETRIVVTLGTTLIPSSICE